MIQFSTLAFFSMTVRGCSILLSSWRYWMPPVILIVIGHQIGLPILLKELTIKCFLSVFYALVGLLFLFSGVYALVNLICLIQEEHTALRANLKKRKFCLTLFSKSYKKFVLPLHNYLIYSQKIYALISFIFLIIIIINVFPMVFWIKYFNSPLLLPLYLILSNMLLYYYCFHTYREVHEERQKLYITSARFKGTTQYDYLKEKRQWVMLNNIRPMFYHLFSFTLFTDYLVLDSKSSGIVGYIFLQLKNGSKTFTNELILALGVSICVLYPIKKLLEYPEVRFARNHSIDKQ